MTIHHIGMEDGDLSSDQWNSKEKNNNNNLNFENLSNSGKETFRKWLRLVKYTINVFYNLLQGLHVFQIYFMYINKVNK